ncbi:CPBP family intramembrane glutamic endopeptidase [Paenibacillus hamazuiensis]|uniref:CPBP family intramembrane glutamic endopeptidase n=1 Tax=Paenibacillus hamazuiensis TaxID=2936508 RepID=UPI0020100635|nr:CPBP family intramembrane glutamic endopeptidase [Paenibacillus hamazuiensis]
MKTMVYLWGATYVLTYNFKITDLLSTDIKVAFSWSGFIASIIYLLIPFLEFILLKYNKDFREKGKEQFARRSFIFPQNFKEEFVFVLLAVSVGITEEVLYRSFSLIYFTGAPFNLGLFSAFLCINLLFGLVHYLQGPQGILSAFLNGMASTYIFLISGSLIIPMLIHMLYDLRIIIWGRMIR